MFTHTHTFSYTHTYTYGYTHPHTHIHTNRDMVQPNTYPDCTGSFLDSS